MYGSISESMSALGKSTPRMMRSCIVTSMPGIVACLLAGQTDLCPGAQPKPDGITRGVNSRTVTCLYAAHQGLFGRTEYMEKLHFE